MSRIYFTVLAVGLMLMFASVPAMTQEESKIDFGINAGLALPSGDFGSTNFFSDNAGGASTGFSVGADLGVLITKGLSWWTSLFLAFNALNEEYVQSATGESGAISGELGSWSTVWPLTGIRYAAPVSEQIELFGGVQVGMLFGTTPDPNATQGNYRFSAESASSSAVAFGFTGGIVLNKRFTGSLRYMTGQATYKYKITSSFSVPGLTSTTIYDLEADHPSSLLQFVVGVRF